MINLRDVAPGDPISHEAWNALLAEVRRLGRLTVTGDAELHDTPSGYALHVINRGGFWAKLIGAMSGLGYYTLQQVIWHSGVDPTADALMADCINSTLTALGPQLVGRNTREIDSDIGEPALSASDIPLLFWVTPIPQSTNEDPPRIIHEFDGRQPRRC